MYILLALIAAAAIGIGLHFLLPHRDERGAVLTPGVAVAVAAAAYSGLTWAQWGEGNVWLWVVTLVASAAAAAAVTFVLASRRTRHDAEERRRAGIA
ncbi:hypothetical protein [Microbacterium halophytorum]|uniref:hypothetical protein n=1 Tax=Microbacterium halophytorum TaxID=2067568 RepID=UPI000CFDF6DC|nr:hypothetical protein [Microbacterium halophytorum]